MLQEFSHGLTFVDFPVKTYGCGGQPYHFNPCDYGVPGTYHNLGFQWWSKGEFVTEYQAKEHNFGWDEDYVLNTGIDPAVYDGDDKKEEIVGTEQSWLRLGQEQRLDLSKDVLFNVQRMAFAGKRYCLFSGMAAILYFARMPFYLFREPWQPSLDAYFPDRRRYKLVQLDENHIPDDIKRDKWKTLWILFKHRMGLA